MIVTRLPPPPRVPDLESEQARGYFAACVRWGTEPEAGAAQLDPDRCEAITVRPIRSRLVRSGDL